ncbi:MAG TPA: type IV toxin-antitoxin system AbiEi family antitoxin [Trueperaceae bacterium]|nr:type IV toxin-antitoxin system AbiEi family antitoxin [Trueperaceae bacterium]
MAAFELDEAFLVDIEDLERLRQEANVKTTAKVIAKRLRDRGWLLPTQHVGVWEFAPGAHAGPIGRGHPFIEVKATLKADPKLNLAVCLSSALWAHGLIDKAPERPEVAMPKGTSIPAGLKKSARVVFFNWRLPTMYVRDTPTHSPATILMHFAARPADVRSWSAVLDALPELYEQVELSDLHQELAGRTVADRTRLAYLMQGIDSHLAFRLAPPDHGKVWFGPRGPLKRHSQTFNLADTVLPISPAELKPHSRNR